MIQNNSNTLTKQRVKIFILTYIVFGVFFLQFSSNDNLIDKIGAILAWPYFFSLIGLYIGGPLILVATTLGVIFLLFICYKITCAIDDKMFK